MKTRGWKWMAMSLFIFARIAVMGQGAEVPGDNFSLEGALELFKKSESPEKFEKMLNSENSKVNNLDLNGDGYIDYIRVIDRNEGNIHTFTLQAVISDTEVQDVAVIALEKKSNGKAVLQIIGDEDVYGMETIIEPTQEVRVNAGTSTTQTVADVWTWPAVQYVYSPYYTVWVSPWSWTMRPVWWYGWHPIVYYRYDSYWRPYRPYYARCYSPRIVYVDRIYRPYRATSVIVHRRHETQITRYRSTHHDDYNRSRSRYNDDRYSGNSRNNDQRQVRSDRPASRSRSNDELARTRMEDQKPVTRNEERNSTSVPRERNGSSVDRQRPSTEQPRERSADRNMHRQQERSVNSSERARTESRSRETVSSGQRQSPRTSSERGSRSTDHSTSGSSRSKRPR